MVKSDTGMIFICKVLYALSPSMLLDLVVLPVYPIPKEYRPTSEEEPGPMKLGIEPLTTSLVMAC